MADSSENQTPERRCPPINELISGVRFESLPDFTAAYLGQLWEIYRDRYPLTEQQPPLSRPGASELILPGNIVPARVWFLTQEKTELIQVQQDAFLYNWRALSLDDEYPRFETVYEEFLRNWQELCSFVERNALGEVQPDLFELTYIDVFDIQEGQDILKQAAFYLPDLQWRDGRCTALQTPRGFNTHYTFSLPEDLGDLIVNVATGTNRRTKQPIVRVESTARGRSEDMNQWFTSVHTFIIDAFKDITSTEAQKQWGLDS